MMFEQPLRHDDIFDHATLQKQIKTPICLDESIHSQADATHAISLGSCQIINLKLGRVGGHAEAKLVEQVAASRAYRSGAEGCLSQASVARTTLRCPHWLASRCPATFPPVSVIGKRTSSSLQ